MIIHRKIGTLNTHAEVVRAIRDMELELQTIVASLNTVVDVVPTQYLVSVSDTSPEVGTDITIHAQLATDSGLPIAEAGRVVTWSKTGGGSFSSPTSVTDDDGIATVTFTVSTVAAIDQLVTATDDSSLTGQSPTITPEAGAADSMTISTEPSATAVGGVAIVRQPVILFIDQYGNATTANGLVVTATPSTGTVSGSNGVASVNGRSTFTTLAFDDIPLVPAANRTLTFSCPTFASVVSDSVLVQLGNDMGIWFAADAAGNTLNGNVPPELQTALDLTGFGRSVNLLSGVIKKQNALINAKPAFDFQTVGSNYMTNFTLPLQGSMSWFGVFKIIASVTYQNLFDAVTGPSQNWLFWDQPANRWQVDGRLAGSAAVDGVWVTMLLHFFNSGSNMQLKVRVNGAQILNILATPLGNPIPGSVGSPSNFVFSSFQRLTGQFPYKSLIAEWGAYNKTIDGTATEAAVESYLRTKYATW